MKNFPSLRLLDKCGGLIEATGADYPTVRKILEVKLTMDSRRTLTVLLGNRPLPETQNGFIRGLWMYVIMGLAMVPFIIPHTNVFFHVSIIFAIFMFFVATSVIADFSSVLLDTRDRLIMQTKPVNPRSLALSRIIHVIIYLSLLTGALTGPAIVASFAANGIVFGLAFVGQLVLMDLFIVGATAFLYLVLLRLLDGERLKDIINYVQIGLSITIILSYQVVGHLFSLSTATTQFHPALWEAILPPLWFGALSSTLIGHQSGTAHSILGTLAVIIPVLTFSLFLTRLKVYETLLQKLTQETVGERRRRGTGLAMLARLVSRNAQERAFFTFASLIISRDHDFKLKAYPALGFSIIFPLLVLFQPTGRHGFHLPHSGRGFFSIFLIGFLLPTTVALIAHSRHYEAAWIYASTPIKEVRNVFRGTLKAILARLFLPVFIIESTIFTILFGMDVLPNLTASLLALLGYSVLCYRLLGTPLPFSQPYQVWRPSSMMWLLLIVLGILALTQYLMSRLTLGLVFYIPVLLMVDMAAWKWGFGVQESRIQP